MTKNEAISLFGKGPIHLAKGLGLSKQAINGWKEELTPGQIDRVIGAYVRLNGHPPKIKRVYTGAPVKLRRSK